MNLRGCGIQPFAAAALFSGFLVCNAQPSITLNTPAAGASQLSGFAYNVDTTKIKVVIYALTNQWYVQPFANAPFTNILPDGAWANFTNPWNTIVALLVDPTNYTPAATEITNPALDPGVIAWTRYPPGPASVTFAGRTWGIKMTGNMPSDQFDPGPNFFSNDPSVVHVASDGLHLKATNINGVWQCGEVYLTDSLGYGTYTVQVSSHLDQLDRNTVAAPLFIYVQPGQELDFEYSGSGGLVPRPYNAQFVVQPYTVNGNIMYYVQPPTVQFTSQMEWAADHVTFRAWNGWSSIPPPNQVIYEWTYTGAYIPPVGQDRVHINTWLLNGVAPVSGVGDEVIVGSFAFQPPGAGPLNVSPTPLTFNAPYMGGVSAPQVLSVSSLGSAVDFTVASDSSWLTPAITSGTAPTQFNVTVTPGTMTPGSYMGNITLTSGSNTATVPVTLNITETGSPCDVNQDGAINVGDVQREINEALGLASAVNDVNGSGSVNVADVQIVINAALGLGCPV